MKNLAIDFFTLLHNVWKYVINSTDIYLFKVNNTNARKRYEISLKLTTKAPESFWCLIVNFEHISHLFLDFLLLILKSKCLLGKVPLRPWQDFLWRAKQQKEISDTNFCYIKTDDEMMNTDRTNKKIHVETKPNLPWWCIESGTLVRQVGTANQGEC